MDITLNFDTLYQKVSRSLSIIGKRSIDDKGNLLFKDITLGSKEKELANDYFRQAVIDLSAELSAFITASNNTAITFKLEMPTNYRDSLESFVVNSCEAYCVSYALYSWFTITAPRIAAKYADDCKRQVAAVIRLIHEKEAPDASSNGILDTSTSVV